MTIGVEYGILLAVALSLMRHVRHIYQPHTRVLEPAADTGQWLPMPARPGAVTAPGPIVHRFGRVRLSRASVARAADAG